MVEVTVKLLPIPQRAQVALAAFDDVEAAGQAVADIIAAGILPAGLEMMDNPSIRAAEDFVHAGYPTQAAAILLCEVDGGNEEVSEDIARVRQRLLDSGASEVRTASDDAERARFWAGAGGIPGSRPDITGLLLHGWHHPAQTPAARAARDRALLEGIGLRVANVFHAGDGNLHPLILYDAKQPRRARTGRGSRGRILELCVEVGGTITGEHGVGLEKINQMCAQFPPEELQVFHDVKAAFDAQGLLNPGKAIPT